MSDASHRRPRRRLRSPTPPGFWSALDDALVAASYTPPERLAAKRDVLVAVLNLKSPAKCSPRS